MNPLSSFTYYRRHKLSTSLLATLITLATLGLYVLVAVLEAIIALVAAAALAALNYIFFAQRREEFGILNAAGRSRVWLVLRSVKESASTVMLAWLIGAAAYVLLLVCAQSVIYTPRGLRLDMFNPTPWLFTLPIPLVVVASATGTIARILSGVDPVSITERR